MDGNEAAARAAYDLSEVAIIYPITPASPMGELCDKWSSKNAKNIFGNNVRVIEMQSEVFISYSHLCCFIGWSSWCITWIINWRLFINYIYQFTRFIVNVSKFIQNKWRIITMCYTRS